MIAAQKERIDELLDQVKRLSTDSESKSNGNENGNAHSVSEKESREEVIQAVEEAFSTELEVHLSRLEDDSSIRPGLRQPISSLLASVRTECARAKGG